MAVFDVLVNNADRKGGHVLAMPDGHRYGVDHGVTFHTDHKLRTVLWGWAGEPLTDEERRRRSTRLRDRVGGRARRTRSAAHAHRRSRSSALGAAAPGCCDRGVLPAPRGEWPAIPWPPF